MANLASNKVSVFPSANRTYDYRGARYTNENNLTGIVKSIIKGDYGDSNEVSYVISAESYLRFVIDGYYFSVDKTALTTAMSSESSVYAYIEVCGSGLDQYLYGTDESGSYYGINFVSSMTGVSPANSGTIHSLLLLEKEDNTWYVPQESAKIYNLSYAYGVVPAVDGGSMDGNGHIL